VGDRDAPAAASGRGTEAPAPAGAAAAAPAAAPADGATLPGVEPRRAASADCCKISVFCASTDFKVAAGFSTSRGAVPRLKKKT